MSGTARRHLVVETPAGRGPEIERWLWALEDTRRRTKAGLDGITQEALDWTPPHGGNGIGTLLYHIAAIEADWLYAEVLEGQVFPREVADLFPYDVRDDEDQLTVLVGTPLEAHLLRLDVVRGKLLAVFRGLTVADFHRPRSLPDYDVTPEWVLHHLMQHEAEHRAQIGTLRELAEQEPETR
jgi:hypothetical protein